jgi:DNA polymerase-3 subunit alpha (Gram-positive type)
MEAGKAFFDVFCDLQLNEDTRELFSTVIVKRVTTNREKSSIRIYILNQYLIHKQKIWEVESAIVAQFFPNELMEVKLIEEYALSAQYTAKNLYQTYMDSMLLEIGHYSHVMQSILTSAKTEFTDDKILQFTVHQSIATEGKLDELKNILEKIFHERCHVPVEIDFVVTEAEKSRHKKDNDFRIAQEVQAIMDMQREKEAHHQKKEEQKQASSAGDSGEKPSSGTQERKQDNHSFTRKPVKYSDDPDVIYGRGFTGEEEEISISQIISEMGEVTIKGKVISVDSREIRGEKTILMFAVTDFTDTIMVKMFLRNENLPEIAPAISKGKFLKIKGITMVDKFDGEITISSVTAIKKIVDFTSSRKDISPYKRVELHCHTKMSDMDGVSSAKDLIKRAIAFGHPALAITDHGVVQGFTDAFHAINDIKKDYKKKEQELNFKILYGMEAYLVDDLKEVITNATEESLQGDYVVFDLETTGFSPVTNKIIEIGAVKVSHGEIVDSFESFVNPKEPIPFRIEQLTSINDAMVMDAPEIAVVLPQFLEFCKGCVLIAHNADFDMSFIIENCKQLGLPQEYVYGDTVAMARVLLPTLAKHKLDNVAKAVGVSLEHHHRAVDDARCTAEIFVKFIDMYAARNVYTLKEVNTYSQSSPELVQKLPTHHAILLATSEVGRIHLYELVSNSHLIYYKQRPRVPKSDLIKHREGILVGSACEAGELFQAIVGGRDEREIARLVDFYDYLEIQPIGNNMFMIESDRYSTSSVEELQDYNRRIVELGKQFHKPVVATCDVHFLDPEDEVYRRIIMAGKGFKDADNQAPLYLRTTEEMLAEFAYLGEQTAYEVVVENTNKIADMCEYIEPVRPDKCPPVIENSDETLRKICYDRAHEMYGDPLPEIVEERLARELKSIINNGFAVMYIIAQKLVWKSNEDGYLVGSRGSVGSSFVATMAGITEVNPLKPHYYCKKCHYVDFDSDTVNAHVGGAGCDLPDATCPNCGDALIKDGFDIPFETFLGFYGDKEPDIDLNFSGEYQSKAHAYTEVIFGKGQTFRAGTIGTLADKTAFGYVKNYFEERGDRKRTCEINRIVEGCTGVRRTTGQHPGGIVVLPHGENINSFTPVQHPANDMTTSIITTHFDYHSIDHNLLKLDILGHDDPTIIRMLQDITGIDPLTIKLDDKKVMSLFLSTEALGVTPEDLHGVELGCLGVPEFGTDFVIGMLKDTKPTHFADLVRISGLSHGTDVWLGNAQTLIDEGKATISTAICTRDDIMTYLINKGVEAGLSFKIMESVRKGKGLSEEWEAEMKAHDVPDWYIWSCKKIKYMFPKAHAAAYVMMAFRIAWFKIYQPLAYYCAYFSIRAKAFDYQLMCQGKERLEIFLEDYKRRNERKELTKNEEDQLKDMKIVQEMYARGFEFAPIDLFVVQAHKFQIVDGKLMPSLDSIAGMGDIAADAVVEAAKDGPFISKDDFRQRTKVSKSCVDTLTELGVLENLPESNQLSLFDFG